MWPNTTQRHQVSHLLQINTTVSLILGNWPSKYQFRRRNIWVKCNFTDSSKLSFDYLHNAGTEWKKKCHIVIHTYYIKISHYTHDKMLRFHKTFMNNLCIAYHSVYFNNLTIKIHFQLFQMCFFFSYCLFVNTIKFNSMSILTFILAR